MPAVSLVVCTFRQAKLLDRLLTNAEGCFDELLVIHDGPDDSGVRQIVERHHGRFFERPRQFTHEPHWPFAWERCQHDWILLFDADEIPSVDLAAWLKSFRVSPPPGVDIAGYTCIWPLWDGRRQVTQQWPSGRLFLIDRQKVRYVGMGENRPQPIGHFAPLPLVLHHQPTRKSYGLGNILRPQAWRWRERIAASLLRKPTELPCWQWLDDQWPPIWEELRQKPIRTGLKRLFGSPIRVAQAMRQDEGRVILSAALFSGPLSLFDRTRLLARAVFPFEVVSRRFPRLLVATEFPPNASGGGPAVVRQMLRGWPTEKLFWWSCFPDKDQRFHREVASHFVAHIRDKFYPHRRLTRFKAVLLRHAWTGWASARFRATVRTCQPDVIWAIPHQWSIPPLARTLRSGGTPYHISIHDYPDARNADERLGEKTTAQMRAQVERLYRDANSRDVISNEMAADMQTRTGRAAENILHAGLEDADFAYLKLKTDVPRDAIKIAYAGTIVAGQTFLLLLESLERIRPRLTKPIELHFFGAHSYREAPWFRKEWMTEHGDLDAEELRTVLREFDWGFTPMEVTDENPRYNRYSLPTKIVSYLAAGLGMICGGHRESTVSCLARKYSFGVAFDDSNLEKIDHSLADALSQTDVWSRYRSEITRCATNEFDANAMQARLFASLGVNGP